MQDSARTAIILISLAAAAAGGTVPGRETPSEAREQMARDTTPEWARRVAPIQALVSMAGREPLVWPGFRPDTIPTLYVVGGHGAVYTNPREPLPASFEPVPGLDGGWTTASPFGELAGRRFAITSVLPDATPASSAGLAVHELFHRYQGAVRSDDRRFGRGESPAGIRLYPAFDAVNMTLLDREARLLARALEARSRSGAESRARDFLAVRTARRSRLPDSVVAYEEMAELNEGIADYVRIRALERWVEDGDPSYGGQAARERAALMARLDMLHRVSHPQLRRIFYATGSGLGKLLDRLDPAWPGRLIRDDATLDQHLTRLVGEGIGDVSMTAAPAVRDFLDSLSHRRAATADSLLATEGISVRLQWPPSPGFQICGLDPLNVRPVGDGRVVHALVRLCYDGELLAMVGRPSVETLSERSIAVPLGIDPVDVEASITVDGDPLAAWITAGMPAADTLVVNTDGLQVEAAVYRMAYEEGQLTAWLAAR